MGNEISLCRFESQKYYVTIVVGPFEEEESLSRAIALRSGEILTERSAHGWTADFIARHFASVLKGNQSIFAHGDLYKENIIVKKIQNPDSGIEEYQIAAIIDWETTGWYLSYWEYGYIFPFFEWIDDWPQSVEKFLDPWPLEGAMLFFIYSDLQF